MIKLCLPNVLNFIFYFTNFYLLQLNSNFHRKIEHQLRQSLLNSTAGHLLREGASWQSHRATTRRSRHRHRRSRHRVSEGEAQCRHRVRS